jgi:hypothetical protein
MRFLVIRSQQERQPAQAVSLFVIRWKSAPLAYGAGFAMCFASGIFTLVVIPAVSFAQVVSAHVW